MDIEKHMSKDGDGYVCQIMKDGKACGAKLARKTFNLNRHIKRSHHEVYKTIEENLRLKRAAKASTSGSAEKITKFLEKKQITISITKEKFERHLVQLVVGNGVAMKLVSSTAIEGLLGEMARILGVQLGNVRDIVLHKTEEMKSKLRSELEGKFIFLKMDACTRHRVNYFAINAQFVGSEGQIQIATLAVRDTQNNHSSDFIRNLVEDVLNDFGICKQQILAVVSDNAANMISTVKKLREERVFHSYDYEDEDDNQFDDILSLEEIVNVTFTHHHGYRGMSHMRCAMHTLQLAIRDGLKLEQAASLLSKIRHSVAVARTPIVDRTLRHNVGKGAILDQTTRWGSTYLMLERLLELKPALASIAHPEMQLTEDEWNDIKRMEELLQHPFYVTKRLQCADLTPGSFFKEWKELIFKFSQIGGDMAEAMKSSMEHREKVLLNNSVLLAAVYVDPMYRVLLQDEELAKGKNALIDIAVAMRDFEENSSHEQASGFSNFNVARPASSPSSTEDEDFEKVLDRQEKQRKVLTRKDQDEASPLRMFKTDFVNALSKMETIDRTSKTSVLVAIPQYPVIIQKVAYAVTALPPTQVSVERLFSALRIIRSDLRTSMKEELLEAILFLRTNGF